MIDVVIPSAQANKEYFEYEKEVAYVERWQNELIRYVLQMKTLADIVDYKERIIFRIPLMGVTPTEELRRILSLPYNLPRYQKFKSATL